LGPNLQGDVCKCTPSQSNSPIFLGNWGDLDGGSGYFSSFNLCFVATTKKGRQLFGGIKVHLRENPGYACACDVGKMDVSYPTK